ncbi:phenazine biosynthesis protein phzE [Actinopolyspora xinjiangensis]|uniref:anthranilate synthase n=1 Tax=Actinopolyspora xinjiangensis TaxID=405564 RepID=A0A1H0W1P5_9ACTN|nr:anthranilate synthase family protein [Actinopolyspora xinjiangensis]SDP84657.1 phenazine biosynthesis protein phzE [Actinopolyspora xinjiangensis]
MTDRQHPDTADLLGTVLGDAPTPFALLHRPETTGPDVVEVLGGSVSTVGSLAELPVPDLPTTSREGQGDEHDLLTLVPYRQIAERGFEAPDEDAPLIALSVEDQQRLSTAELFARVPDTGIELTNGHFDVDDETYAATVRRIIDEEIGSGAGANFVFKRSFVAEISDYSTARALTVFRRLLEGESGAYWTYLVHTGRRTFVGASPERHISLRDEHAVMNPISGTYRYPESGPSLSGVLDFLDDSKEVDELYMVVDEELKMMSRICDRDCRVTGPHLKEMARLAHTEYFVHGHSTRDVREILRETMFAPTVTGSPLESAARVIRRYEPAGRGYYSGVAALIGRDARGGRTLDSSILIRAADIDGDGRLRIGVGATLVRDSEPESEVAETRAKAAGMLAALQPGTRERFDNHPSVRDALEQRNSSIAKFWLSGEGDRNQLVPELTGLDVLVVDAEDTFTSMIGHQLRSLGLSVTVRRFDEPYSIDSHDLVVMGPGPGDPTDGASHKIAVLRATIERLLSSRKPFVAVCLSHQVLSSLLGLPIIRREHPNQGAQHEIDLFGSFERVGFYNTFAARADSDEFVPSVGGVVEVSRDPVNGEVHALRGQGFASVQFHAESVLTVDGPRIIRELVTGCWAGSDSASRLVERRPV